MKDFNLGNKWLLFGVALFASLFISIKITLLLLFIMTVVYFSPHFFRMDIVSDAEKERDKIIETAKKRKKEIIDSANKEKRAIIHAAKKEGRDIVSHTKKKLQQTNLELQNAIIEKENLETTYKNLKDEVLFIETNVDYSSDITSSELKNNLQLMKVEEKILIKEGGATQPNTFVFDESSYDKKSKQLIRAFNSEADCHISTVTIRNVDGTRNKIIKSYTVLNNLFLHDNVELTSEFLTLKLDRLETYYQYQRQLLVEKEILKAKKEEIREQQRAENEIKNRKAEIEKEEKHFKEELNRQHSYLRSINDDVLRKVYLAKIQELEDKLKALEKDKKDILRRETNTRAGFVYIISNIGSFGENVYKIGMTRRLEPMDRINELSSASVPFPFDVHAFIFSEDAPALENTLHNHFKEKAVNKVNYRKEFYNVTLEEIKKVVTDNFDETVHFTDLAIAEQYYDSLNFDV